MSSITIKKKPFKGLTNWKSIEKLPEAQLLKASLTDPEMQPISEEDLASFARVNPSEGLQFQRVRENLGISTQALANIFGVSIRTLVDWEQDKVMPPQIAKNFLKVIDYAPKIVELAVSA